MGQRAGKQDTRFLQLRGSCWFLRFRMPRAWNLPGAEYVKSLHTSDLKVAQGLRDKYVLPVLAETTGRGIVRSLAHLLASADDNLRAELAAMGVALNGETEGLSLRKAGDAFLKHLGSSGTYAASTLAKYGASLETVCRLLGDDTDLDRIAKADMVRLREQLAALPRGWQRTGNGASEAGTKLSAQTVANILKDTKRVLQWAIDEGRISRTDNPLNGVKVARTQTQHKRPPTLEEAAALMALPKPLTIDERTWRWLPVLGRYTGMRLSEIAQLTVADIVTEQGVECFSLSTQRHVLKTASSARLVPVAETVSAELDELVSGSLADGRLLDGYDWHGANGVVKRGQRFGRPWNKGAKAVGDGLCFHCWRVYANSQMASHHVEMLDRQRILGHKSALIQAAYTPQDIQRLKAAVDTIP